MAPLAAILGLGALLLATAGASAFSMTLDVVLVLDKVSYQVGDRVNATVYVLDRGVLADADSVSLVVSAGSYPSWSEAVGLLHVALGTYRGSFEILANMTDPFLSGIGLRAAASLGYLFDSEDLIVAVPAQYTPWVELLLSDYSAAPGKTVSGTMRTYLNEQLRDANQVNVSARMTMPGHWGSPEFLAVENLSVGTYRFSYTVPASLSQSQVIEIRASATFAVPGGTTRFTNSAPLRVDVTNPFIVWYHQVSLTTEAAVVDLWVADSAGLRVANATASLNVFACTPSCRIVSLQGVTNLEGRASFNVTLNTTWNVGAVGFWGFVSKGSANQSYAGVLRAPPTENPPYIGFRLQRNNPLDVFAAGETAVLNYSAYSLGILLANTTIYYTAHSPTALIAHGNVLTDADGKFDLRFPMPTEGVTIDFSAEVSPNAWYSVSDNVLPARHLDVRMGALRVGSTTRAIVSLPSEGAPWAVSMELYPHNESEFPVLRPDWAAVLDSSPVFWDPRTLVTNESTLELDLILPSYLPSNRSYVLRIEAFPMTGRLRTPYIFSQLVYVSAGSSAPTGFPSILLLSVGSIAVGAAVLLAVLVIRLRRAGRRPPSSDG